MLPVCIVEYVLGRPTLTECWRTCGRKHSLFLKVFLWLHVLWINECFTKAIRQKWHPQFMIQTNENRKRFHPLTHSKAETHTQSVLALSVSLSLSSTDWILQLIPYNLFYQNLSIYHRKMETVREHLPRNTFPQQK